LKRLESLDLLKAQTAPRPVVEVEVEVILQSLQSLPLRKSKGNKIRVRVREKAVKEVEVVEVIPQLLLSHLVCPTGSPIRFLSIFCVNSSRERTGRNSIQSFSSPPVLSYPTFSLVG
jgi:hypothetical protein